ncbi:glycosyltransferase family 2 protein [Actinomadura xylanilytica]|uniref:glycosyltransferase family 2 protein n=1 Tax=Actinomadura xylanilytica TaxID=887459 RepID=UPI0032E524C4
MSGHSGNLCSGWGVISSERSGSRVRGIGGAARNAAIGGKWSRMGSPKVSVIVPVHNSRSTLRRTFQSVFDQTLPADQIEIIAVDDGSTDGSGEELDRLAAGRPGFEVVHQAASGGPGRPRNVGIERATGEYVFFLDADDYFGPEALERCCALADEHGTDVVVPKYVGIGRKINPHLFRTTVEFTTIFDAVPNLYGSITALKLYRRSLLDRHRIRFPEKVLSGEDQIFAVRAYFEAKGVSVLADYDCYYWVDREDGGSALQAGGAPAAAYFPEIKGLMAFVAERTAPGEVRDRLLRRHFAIEVFSRFDPRYPRFSADERRATRSAARDLIAAFGNPEIMGALSPYMRLLDHALRHGLDDLVDEAARVHTEEPPPIVLDGDRAYMAYPGFRDPALDVPDAVYQVNGPLSWRRGVSGVEWRAGRLAVRGHAFVERADGVAQDEELVLRERDGRREYRVPFRKAGETDGRGRTPLLAEIDFGAVAGGGPLPPGRWDTFAVVHAQGRVHEGRLVPAPGSGVGEPGARVARVRAGSPVVTPYLTKGVGALALHAGGLAGLAGPVTESETAVTAPARLRLSAELETALPDGADAPAVRAVLRHRESDETRTADLAADRRTGAAGEAGRFWISGEIDLGGAGRGKWDVHYEVTVGSATGTFRAPAVADPGGGAGRGPRPFRTARGNLSVEVVGGTSRLMRLLRRGRS